VLGVLHNNLGATFIRSADVEAGLEHLDAAQAFFEQAQARDVLPEMHRHRACAALLAGKLSEAEAHGQQALGLARELAVRAEEGNALRVLGEIAARQGRFETAIEYLYESIAILEQVGDEYEQARSQLSLAMLHASLGDCQSAGSAVEACLPVFERLGAKLDLDGARTLRSSLPSAPQP
jgi:tetratricopeptide (TPR) repeat protein